MNSNSSDVGAPHHELPDLSHATVEVGHFFEEFFTAKIAHDVDATMRFFNRSSMTYIDATLGYYFGSWEALHDLFAEVMPAWAPDVKSYAVRILGDADSAVVFFVDTAGSSGPNELRITGVVDFTDGTVARWVDYWDGRHVTLPVLKTLKVPASAYPRDFEESKVRPHAASAMRRTATALSEALVRADAAAAAALFADDAVPIDVAAHLSVNGRYGIERLLRRSAGDFPWAQSSAKVRHVVGSAGGGGWEWTAQQAVPRGVNAVELDRSGKITSFTAVWDGSFLTEQQLSALAALAIVS